MMSSWILHQTSCWLILLCLFFLLALEAQRAEQEWRGLSFQLHFLWHMRLIPLWHLLAAA